MRWIFVVAIGTVALGGADALADAQDELDQWDECISRCDEATPMVDCEEGCPITAGARRLRDNREEEERYRACIRGCHAGDTGCTPRCRSEHARGYTLALHASEGIERDSCSGVTPLVIQTHRIAAADAFTAYVDFVRSSGEIAATDPLASGLGSAALDRVRAAFTTAYSDIEAVRGAEGPSVEDTDAGMVAFRRAVNRLEGRLTGRLRLAASHPLRARLQELFIGQRSANYWLLRHAHCWSSTEFVPPPGAESESRFADMPAAVPFWRAEPRAAGRGD